MNYNVVRKRLEMRKKWHERIKNKQKIKINFDILVLTF